MLDLFDHKTIGLFCLLNDECKLRNPSLENFVRSLKNSWEKQTMAPIKWNTMSQRTETTFLIQHFTADVRYATVC